VVGIYGRYDWEDRSTAERDRFVDFLERVVVGRKIAKHPDIFRKASPIARVHADAPPFLVIHGTGDSVIPVEQARRLRRAVARGVAFGGELRRAAGRGSRVRHDRRRPHRVDDDGNRPVPQSDSPQPFADQGKEGYIGSSVWEVAFETAERVGRCAAVQRDSDGAHAHPQARGDRHLELKGRQFGIDEFRQVIHSRLYKLDPFRYELVDIPFKFHHPMWRENCEVDLDYHVRPYRVDSPGGRRQLDEAVGRIASTPLDRSKPLWEMYLIEGLANGRIAVLGKIHHALADGGRVRESACAGNGPACRPEADRDSYATDPAPGARN